MARTDINRSGELEVFVRVIETGGFSAAARSLEMTPSAVSKLVARLEQRLGTRLLQRSTRQLQLTPEGCAFYERGLRVLADLEEAERCASAHAEPRGRLRVNANVPFGQHFLLPLLPEFLQRHPQVGVDLTLTDEVIDLLEQRTDVAVRAGPLKSSSLVARRLGATRMMIVAAPAYAARHGLPANADALLAHNRLDIGHVRSVQGWPLLQDGQQLRVLPSGNARASNGDALRQLVLGGLGLARLAAFQVQADIAAGRLLPVLEDANPGDLEEVHAVFLGQGGYLPLRVRAFLDFLVENVDLTQPRGYCRPLAGSVMTFAHARRVAGQRPALPGLRPRASGCRPAAGTTRRQACSRSTPCVDECPRFTRANRRAGAYTCSSLRAAARASLLTSTPPSMRASSSSRAFASSFSTALWVMPSTGALLTR